MFKNADELLKVYEIAEKIGEPIERVLPAYAKLMNIPHGATELTQEEILAQYLENGKKVLTVEKKEDKIQYKIYKPKP